jgi:hypothetical protein
VKTPTQRTQRKAHAKEAKKTASKVILCVLCVLFGENIQAITPRKIASVKVIILKLEGVRHE